jgi:hypothetical protein
LPPNIQNFNKASKKSWGKLLPKENLPLISKGNIDFPPTFLTGLIEILNIWREIRI